jgi:threonine synthase
MSSEIPAMFELTCGACGLPTPDGDGSACPVCGGFIEIGYPQPFAIERGRPGIWRYSARLPLRDAAHAVSLGEGDTPLLPAGRLGTLLSLPGLHFKLEGANPTGSYKDRIAAVGIARLRERGKAAWAATSSGNAGAAIAAYGARAGVPGHLFTLEKAAPAKLAQILAYGPSVRAVARLGYDPAVERATWRNIATLCAANNWLMLVTARTLSPHAMEGAKTISYEVCEQLGERAPDVVYAPVGGGGLLSASWKGFVEWRDAGLAQSLPRMVAVQAGGCDPVAQAWAAGRPVAPIAGCSSTISGIQLTAPPDGDLALRALRESGGWAVSVPDEETYRAQADLAALEGIFVEPAAATTLAAVRADLASGRLRGDEIVACWLTGVGFKDAAAVQRMAAGRAVERIQVEEILSLVAG